MDFPGAERARGSLSTAIVCGLFLGALMLFPAASEGTPIESDLDPAPTLPASIGSAWSARPVTSATRPPANPFLARGAWSNIHNDTWMTDAYPGAGPLGVDPVSTSGASVGGLGLCASLAFDRFGRIVSVCPSSIGPPRAQIINPDSLEIIASLNLPDAAPVGDTPVYQDYTGGGYFFLDQRKWLWVPTRTNHLRVLEPLAGSAGFKVRRDIDLSSVLDPATERITSALPDFQGRVWFVSKQNGVIGTWNRKTGRIRSLRLGEWIQNSFAVDRKGVYVVSDRKLYRFGTDRSGKPKIDWKATYRNSGQTKPGQADDGSGTTPTILKDGFVAITDNADPMNVVVYRTGIRLGKGLKRKVCEVPVFPQGASATENSLIGTGRSLIVENNYGYTNPFVPEGPAVSSAGLARVDIAANGKSCRKVWTNEEVRAPTLVPKMSNSTGLIYLYERPDDPSGNEGYYWSAVSFHTGECVWRHYAGSGILFNNNYAGIMLGPDGTAYLGVIGGVVALRDACG